MDYVLSLLGLVIRFLLFFVVIRNIARNKAYGWDRRDYSGMVLIALVFLYSWFSSRGLGRAVLMLFLGGAALSAVFEGLGNRKGALISAMGALALMIASLLS